MNFHKVSVKKCAFALRSINGHSHYRPVRSASLRKTQMPECNLSIRNLLCRRYVSFDNGYGNSVGLSTRDIRYFLQSKNIKVQSGPTCFQCENIFPKTKSPRQGRPRKDDVPNMTLYVNKTTGHFFCTDTGHRGKWDDFKEYMSRPHRGTDVAGLQGGDDASDSDNGKIKKIWEEDSVPLSDIPDLSREELLMKLHLDALPISDLEQYCVRAAKNMSSLIVPWFTNQIGSSKHMTKGNPIGLKIFSNSENNGRFTNLHASQLPRKNYWSLLGLSNVSANSKCIVLTMNEFDAIAINSVSSKHKAVSLPSGATYLPLEVLPYLEQFNEIILWFDNNLVSWEAARQFSKKLNEKRCRLVRPTPSSPSPLQALSQNLDVDKILSSAVSAEIKNIVSFTDLRGFVKDELMNCDTVCGVKWKRFPHLTSKLKGHRRGELSVFTGPTGSGKTTLMSEYSLDLAIQGVSTLWGSFEIQNVRLIKTMMKQFARSKLENHMTDFEDIADKFQTLPINFMTYNGPQGIKEVIHTMRQAAYVYDIQHIVIDNLQFMMGTMSKNNDRFMVQDQLIGEFRNFASTEHIHVTLVIHPRKEDAGLPLQISSIFGTAKATQEADNVLILQQVKGFENNSTYTRNYLEIAKNRYDGELGKVSLYFDRNTLCMSKPPDMTAEDRKEDPSVESYIKKERVTSPGLLCGIGDKTTPNSPTSSPNDFTPPWFVEWQEKKPN